MTWWQALILGVVEGLTEYLPVSSTGHLIIAAWLLGMDRDPATWQLAFSFNIVIQVGAIAAVGGLYWRRIVGMARGIVGRDEQGRKLAFHLAAAFVPAAVMGPVLSGPIRAHLNGPWPVAGALFAGAWLMLAVAMSRKVQQNQQQGWDLDQLTIPTALLIGFGQCLAMWPGMSRSMMTIVAALMLGARPRAAAEFSFLLGLATLTAATGYESMQHGPEMLQAFGWTPIVIGLIASTISAALAVKWFVAFLARRGLAPFGWYRIVVAVILTLALWRGYLTVHG